MQFKLTNFEVKRLGENSWQEIPEKMFLEKLMDCFDPVTPAISIQKQIIERARSLDKPVITATQMMESMI